jgi:hypothetical protein
MSESIRVEQLSKLYHSRDGTEVEALRDVSFTVGRQSLGQVRAGRTISAILNCALTELGFFRGHPCLRTAGSRKGYAGPQSQSRCTAQLQSLELFQAVNTTQSKHWNFARESEPV